MPPRTPSIPIDTASVAASHLPFICNACRRRASLTPFFRSRLTRLRPRYASTTTSITAVNTKREILPAFQALHASLKKLESDAGIYINTSQLQLALRGLEGRNAVTRVAGQWDNSKNEFSR